MRSRSRAATNARPLHELATVGLAAEPTPGTPVRPAHQATHPAVRALAPERPPRTSARRFLLQRDEDVHGISGTGVVAEGVRFSNGKVVMTWLSSSPTVTLFEALEDVERIHGHDGRTHIEWVDR